MQPRHGRTVPRTLIVARWFTDGSGSFRRGNVRSILRFLMDTSVEETAAVILECTAGTVRSQTAKALRWIPAEDLVEYNRNIVGLIKVVDEFHRSIQ